MADRTVVYRLIADASQFKRGMGEAETATRKASGQMDGATQKSRGLSDGLDVLGVSAGAAGAAIGTKVIMAAANFEQSMSSVQAATRESAANMDRLRSAALEAGADTAFSADEAAGAIENLAKAGVSTGDILGGGLTGALDLAAAGQLEVADAAEIAATALTQFNLAGEDVPHVADLLAAGAGKAQGEVTDLAQALKQSGLVASQMGISLEDTTGTLAAFASAGLLGSDAGTSFRTMLLRLANPTKESSDLMRQLGINAYDANGEFVGMASLAGQLQTAFEGKTQAERDSAMATLFGSDAIRAANVLYTQGQSGIEGWTTAVNDQGYAAETAAIQMDNLKGSLEELKGSIETAMIGQGDDAVGPLRQTLDLLTALTNGWNEASTAVSDWGGNLSAIVGGPVTTLLDAGGNFWDMLTGGDGAESEIKATASATEDLGSAVSSTATDLETAEAATERFEAALEGLNAELSGRAALRDYEAALDDFTASLKENGKTFDINTAKGRANQAALDEIASSALEVAEGLGTADRQKFLTESIKDIRQMGREMGLPKSEVKALIGLLRDANNTDVNPTIRANTIAAEANLKRIRDALAQIKDKSVTVRITQTGSVVQNNTGGFGPQTPYASGGWTGPGEKFDPKGVVHGDEYVFSKEATHGNVAYLDALHRSLRGYADGGYVGATYSQQAFAQRGSTTATDPIASEIKELRSVLRDLRLRLPDDLKEGARIGTREGIEGKEKTQAQRMRVGAR